jgi:hypothetical protein
MFYKNSMGGSQKKLLPCGLMQRQLFLLWHEKQWMQLVDL